MLAAIFDRPLSPKPAFKPHGKACCSRCHRDKFLPPRWLCGECDAISKAISLQFTASTTPWVISLQKKAYKELKFTPATMSSVVLDVVPLSLFRAICKHLRTLPGGLDLPERAPQTKGMDGGMEVEMELRILDPETSEALLSPGFKGDTFHESTMRFFPDKSVLAYLTPPLVVTFSTTKNASYGHLSLSFDVTTWSADGTFNYGDAGWSNQAKLVVQHRMYQHAAELVQRQVLPSGISKRVSKWARRRGGV